MSAKIDKPEKTDKVIKGLSKDEIGKIDAFLNQSLPINKKGQPKWDKAPVKKLSGFQLCKDTDKSPILMFNDGQQRFGFTIKSWDQYAHVKQLVLRSFVDRIDYLDSIAKHIFAFDGKDSDRINSL